MNAKVNRRIAAVLVLLVCGSALTACGSGPGSTITAREIAITDRWGHTRIKLFIDEKDNANMARLNFYGPDGQSLLMALSANEHSEPVIVLTNPEMGGLMMISATRTGQSLSLVGKSFRGGVAIGNYQDRTEVVLNSPQNDRAAILSAMRSGGTGLVLTRTGEYRAGMILDENGAPLLGLYGRDKRPLVEFP